jgi:dTDP-4-dehydrorhamnose reductase
VKLLILGANGQVGREFSELSKKTDYQIICMDRKEIDLTDDEQICNVLSAMSPDVVINCAAYTAVDRAEVEPDLAFRVNARALKVLAKTCAINNFALIHISTDYVFDGHGEIPFKESDPTAPTGVYGKTKLAGENAIRTALNDHVILRTAWVFGEHGNNFVKTMIRAGATKEELGIVSDQWGSPTSARGIAECCLNISGKIASDRSNITWGTYHYSGLPYTSWYGFAETIFTQAMDIGLINDRPKLRAIDSVNFPSIAKRPANSRLDCTKLYDEFGVSPDEWIQQLSSVLEALK